ncbi:hypothetical protein GEMRC1_004432 [Eukaryota sp. GEM-RC1]
MFDYPTSSLENFATRYSKLSHTEFLEYLHASSIHDAISSDVLTKLFLFVSSEPHIKQAKMIRKFFARNPTLDSSSLQNHLDHIICSSSTPNPPIILILSSLLQPPFSSFLPYACFLNYLKLVHPRLQTIQESTTFSRLFHYFLRFCPTAELQSLFDGDSSSDLHQLLLGTACACFTGIHGTCLALTLTDIDFIAIKDSVSAAISTVNQFDLIVRDLHKKESTQFDLLEQLIDLNDSKSSSVSLQFISIKSHENLFNIFKLLSLPARIVVLKSFISIIDSSVFRASFLRIISFLLDIHFDRQFSVPVYLIANTLNRVLNRASSGHELEKVSSVHCKMLKHFKIVLTSGGESINGSLWQSNFKLWINFLVDSGYLEMLDEFLNFILSVSQLNNHKYLALTQCFKIFKPNPSDFLKYFPNFNHATFLTETLPAGNDPNVCHVLDDLLIFYFPILAQSIKTDWISSFFTALYAASTEIDPERLSLFASQVFTALVNAFPKNFKILNSFCDCFLSMPTDKFDNSIIFMFSYFEILFKYHCKTLDKINFDVKQLVEIIQLCLNSNCLVALKFDCLKILVHIFKYSEVNSALESAVFDLLCHSLFLYSGSDEFTGYTLIDFLRPVLGEFCSKIKVCANACFYHKFFSLCLILLNPSSPQSRRFFGVQFFNYLISSSKIGYSSSEFHFVLNDTGIIPSKILNYLIYYGLLNSWEKHVLK